MIERAADMIGVYLRLPSSDAFSYITNMPCKHADRMNELEAARFLLPNPKMASEVHLKLSEHDSFSGDIFGFQNIWPVSLMTEAPTKVHLANRVRRLGAQSSRILGTMPRFARDRRRAGSFNRATQYLFTPRSQMEAMKRGQGSFSGLRPADYHEFHSELIDVVKHRPVRIGLFDDRLLDWRSRRFLGDFDCLMVVGSEFAMSVHRGRLSRGLCERTSDDSLRNRYIEHVRHVISSIKKCVDYDIENTAAMIKALNALAL